jgi:hypothetical protein
MALGSRQGRHNFSCNAIEIETQRQLAFFLLVGHGNGFIEEILAPPRFIRFGPNQSTSQPHLAERRAFALQAGCIHHVGCDLMSTAKKNGSQARHGCSSQRFKLFER